MIDSTLYSPIRNSDQDKPRILIPIAFVKNRYDNGANGYYCGVNRIATWDEFCQTLEGLSRVEFPDKEAAPLFIPTTFNGTRIKEHAQGSGCVALDYDKGLLFDEAVASVTEIGLEAIIYSSARNQMGDLGDRFRVVLPLAGIVDVDTHILTVRAVAETLKPGVKPDNGKMNCYSLFYTPGTYRGAVNRYSRHKGHILSADEWLEICPQAPTPVVVKRGIEPTPRYDNNYEDIPALCHAALQVIPNDATREEWIAICFAIRDAGLDYNDWRDWCAKWTGGINTEKAMTAAWNSCNPRAITFRTLLKAADDADPSWRSNYYEQKRLARYLRYADQMKNWRGELPTFNGE